jgi:hypothetical protein
MAKSISEDKSLGLSARRGEIEDALKGMYYALIEGQGDGTGTDMLDAGLSPEMAEQFGAGTLRGLLKKSADKLEGIEEIGLTGLQALVTGPGLALQTALGTEDWGERMEFYGANPKDQYKHLNKLIGLMGGEEFDEDTLKSFGMTDILNDVHGFESLYQGAGGKFVPRAHMLEMQEWIQKRLGTELKEDIDVSEYEGQGDVDYLTAMLGEVDTGDLDFSDLKSAYAKDKMMLETGLAGDLLGADMSQLDALTAEEFATDELSRRGY